MHIPVLLNEVIGYLEPKPNENFVDCTVGQGGHTKLILEKTAPNGKVLGIDLDAEQIENCKNLLLAPRSLGEVGCDRLILINDNYANLSKIIKENNFKNINGILLDVGFSSFQVDDSKKGFSFLRDEVLDMRYNTEIQNSKFKIQNELTASVIVNEWREEEIKKILEEYGEEKFARQIAKKIIEVRSIKEIKTTFELVRVIEKSIPSFAKATQGKHCATRTFQALRIAVNDELGNLEKVLPQAIENLTNGGRLVVISFHSLEDRIVKNFFKQKQEEGIIKILTKKPIEALPQEIIENPRSRSAKLRAVIKL